MMTRALALETPSLADGAEAVLLRLAGKLAGLLDPDLILATAAAEVGRHLHVDRCGYGEVDLEQDQIVIPVDWAEGLPSMVGRYPLHRGSTLARSYEAGRTGVLNDAAAADLPKVVRANLASMRCRAFIAAPLLDDGRLVGLFAVHSHVARMWTPAEIELVERTAVMTRSALRQARTGAKLRESEETFRSLADNIPGICWLASPQGLIYWVNAVGRRYFGDVGDTAEDIAAFLHPDDAGAAAALWTDALRAGASFETMVRVRGAEQGYRPFLSRAAPIRNAGGVVVRWCGVLVDLTERQAHDRRQALLRGFQDAVRDGADVAAILTAAAAALAEHMAVDELVFVERQSPSNDVTVQRYLAAGPDGPAAIIAGAGPAVLDSLHEDGEPLAISDCATAPSRAMPGARAEGAALHCPISHDGQVAAVLCAQMRAPRSWSPDDIELCVELADRLCSTLSRARADETLRDRDWAQAFLVDWSDALRRVDTPDAIMAMTLAALGRYLGATRVTYAENDATGRVFTTRWNWSEGCGSLVGLQVHLDTVGPRVELEWLTGTVVRYDDVTRDPQVSDADRATYAVRQIAAFVSIPLVRGASVRAILSVQSAQPRAWRDAEVRLIRDVGERTWAVLERARAQAELHERDREQRFRLAWSDSVRAESDPGAILDTTVRMLAQHLGVSRAAYSRIDLDGVYRIVNEWCTGVAPTLGLTYPASNLSAQVRAAYLAGETLVSAYLPADARFSAIAREKFAANQVFARIGVPLSRGGVVQAVLSIDERQRRAWTQSEVRLAREIAEQMWVLLHRAQAEASLKERERNQSFLVAWNDRIRDEASPRAILAATLAMIATHLGAARANYAETVGDGVLEVRQEWRDGAVGVVGHRFALAALGEGVIRAHLAGAPVVVESVQDDARLDVGARSLYETAGVAAFVSMPMVRNGRLEAMLSLQSEQPRAWSGADVQLLRDIADRTWAVLERARSEERMADTEALLDAFMENAPLGMHLKDANGRYLRMNPELARQIAIPAADVVGRLPEELLPPRTARRILELEQRALAGQIASAEFLFPDRTDYTALLAVMFPIKGSRGVARIGGFTLDLTARKAAEAALQKSRDALHQSEKLTALGSLLAGVSHELNNPLAIVVAQAVMMERQAKNTDLADRAAKIRRAADRCARIVQTFLAMARQKRPERSAVDLNAVVDAALELAGYGLRTEGMAIDFRRAGTLPVIAADADQIHQIIVNLIVNAQHAMVDQAGARTLTLSTAIGPEPDTVILDVADSGPGVPETLARRIFEPFFTTKVQGEGTGLGLSFSQGLAEAHGGRLALVPQATGACFRLTLPVAAEHILPPVPPHEPVEDQRAPHRRALLIDDEVEIAEAVADFLLLDGFSAEIVSSAMEACARLETGSYDLVVSDLRMPGMDGAAFYAWVCENRPALAARVGFVTGDTLGSSVARFLEEAGRPVLEKPFTPESVRRFVQDMALPAT